MKKMLFLMLFPMILGVANVSSQVRIGGNGQPNPAAVLDLNTDDSATPSGNKGALALPRVNLASATAPLNETTPINGMLVYNTSATLGEGVYYWSGSQWQAIMRGSTVASDSGKFLMSNGKTWVPSYYMQSHSDSIGFLPYSPKLLSNFYLSLDTSLTLSASSGQGLWFGAPTVFTDHLCTVGGGQGGILVYPGSGRIIIRFTSESGVSPTVYRIRCYQMY